MKNLRLWITVLILWLIFFFNIERFFGADFNFILTDTYIFVALVVLVTLMLPKIRTGTFSLLLTTAVALFLIFWVSHPVWRKPLAFNVSQMIAITLLTLIQTSTIILSGLITRQISRAMGEFEDTIAKITYSHIGLPPKPFADEQGIMYRELKRARRYQRPLSVLALQVDQQGLAMTVPPLVQKVQQGMINELTLANIARVLDRELHDFNVIALRDDHFIIVLPELPIEETSSLSQRLGKAVQDEIGVKLRIGAANFPTHAETFESLIEQAIEASSQGKPVDSDPDPARLGASSTA